MFTPSKHVFLRVVGGVCSEDVASALAELVVMVGWDSMTNFKDNIGKFITSENLM